MKWIRLKIETYIAHIKAFKQVQKCKKPITGCKISSPNQAYHIGIHSHNYFGEDNIQQAINSHKDLYIKATRDCPQSKGKNRIPWMYGSEEYDGKKWNCSYCKSGKYAKLDCLILDSISIRLRLNVDSMSTRLLSDVDSMSTRLAVQHLVFLWRKNK